MCWITGIQSCHRVGTGPALSPHDTRETGDDRRTGSAHLRMFSQNVLLRQKPHEGHRMTPSCFGSQDIQRHPSDRRSSKPLHSLLSGPAQRKTGSSAESTPMQSSDGVGVRLVLAARVASASRRPGGNSGYRSTLRRWPKLTNLGGESEAHGRKRLREAHGNVSPESGLLHGVKPRGRDSSQGE